MKSLSQSPSYIEKEQEIEAIPLNTTEANNLLSLLSDKTKISVFNDKGEKNGDHNTENLRVFGLENLIFQKSSDLVIENGTIVQGTLEATISLHGNNTQKGATIEKGLRKEDIMDKHVLIGNSQILVAKLLDLPGIHLHINEEKDKNKNNQVKIRHTVEIGETV